MRCHQVGWEQSLHTQNGEVEIIFCTYIEIDSWKGYIILNGWDEANLHELLELNLQ